MLLKFRTWFGDNYKSIIRFTYIIPILFVAGVSIAHVISWYAMTNPISWAIYLSIGIEIAALSALAGMATKLNKAVYLPFGIVTFIQFIGNMFFAFQFIDVTSELFKDWVLLVDPIFNMVSMNDTGDIDGHRRWLAVFGGAMLPLISLSFLHLLVKFNDKEKNDGALVGATDGPKPGTIISDVLVGELPMDKYVHDVAEKFKNHPAPSGNNDAVSDAEIEARNEAIREHLLNEPVTTGNDEGINEGINEGVNEEPVTTGDTEIDLSQFKSPGVFVEEKDTTDPRKRNKMISDLLVNTENGLTESPESLPESEAPVESETPEEPEVIDETETPEPKREPVIPTGQIKREDIPEVKNSNTIQRIGSNKVIKNNNEKKVFFKKNI